MVNTCLTAMVGLKHIAVGHGPLTKPLFGIAPQLELVAARSNPNPADRTATTLAKNIDTAMRRDSMVVTFRLLTTQ